MSLFDNLTEKDLLALVIYGEARNQGYEGMLAVGWVVMNRLKKDGWFGKTIHEVILKPWQFSCFNEKNPERKPLERIAMGAPLVALPDISTALAIAKDILNGIAISNVKGSTHYHTVAAPPGAVWPPPWTYKMKFICQIKDHLFYEEVL